MRDTRVRQRTVRLAVMAASMAVLAAACSPGGGKNPGASPTGNGAGGPAGVTLTPGTLLISDGSSTVTIGGVPVTFPGPVTDAAWSPDGSRIAYIDGNGNVATARPDGSDVAVLTRTNASVTRSRPAWSRAWIYYAEKKGDGTSTLMFVTTNGCPNYDNGPSATGTDWPMDTGDGTSYVDLAPSAATGQKPSRVAFQHNEPSGPEIWIDDSNLRTPHTYKVVNGAEPALTLDGTKLAYVGRDGSIYGVTDINGDPTGDSMGVSPTGASHLVWSPDGSHLAYETPNGVEEIALRFGGANAPRNLAEKPGVPSYLPGTANVLNTVTGADAVALSVAASQAGFPGTPFYLVSQSYAGAYGAVITTPEHANAANPDYGYGPRLLTAPDKLDDRVVQELERLFGDLSHPELHGQPTVNVSTDISAAVVNQLTGMGFDVKRFPISNAPQPPGGTCGPLDGNALFQQKVAIVDASDPVAVGVAHNASSVVIYVNGGALTQDQITFLQHSSGVIESAYTIGGISAELQQQVGDLIAGPRGFTLVNNPVQPMLELHS